MEVTDFLKQYSQPGKKYAVLGVGSVLCSDDAAGMYLIERLNHLIHREDVLLIAGSTAPENFTGVIKNFSPDRLFIVDAAFMELSPGDTKVVPACDIDGLSFSTHMLPMSVMLEYLKTESGCEVTFIGIQPKSTEQGLTMSDEVKKGTKRLARAFCDALT